MEEKERRKVEMSSVLDSRRQFDFKTVSRNPDMKESCYVCGASQAFWSLHSKPTGDDVPFFPFLEYHKPPCNQERLDSSGKVLACNVCYSFLVQQWDSYEATRTPILKRLYWLKRMNTDLSRSQSPVTSVKSDSAADSSSEFNDREKYSLHPNEMPEELDKTEERAIPSFRSISSLFGMTREISTRSPSEEIGLQGQKRNLVKDVGSLYEDCLLCGKEILKSSMKAVHSRAQIKPDTPFYPFLQQLVPHDGDKVLDSQGKGNVCPQCYTNLFSQWQVFQTNNTPVSERKYQFSFPLESNQERVQEARSDHEERMWLFKNEDNTSCPLCGHSDPQLPDCQISAVKRNAKDPFYPFLKNLPVPMDEGWVNVCPKCKDVLDSTWMAYEMDGTATEDRLYQMHIDQEASRSPIPHDRELVCLVCGKSDTLKAMKSAFSSPYANMNFDFLEKLEPRPGALFKKRRGEALICAGCYHSLRNQWVHFELHQVPLSSRKFQLHTLFRQEKHSKEKRGSETRHLESCELCEVECPVEATAWIEVFPSTSEQAARNGKPFFPYLAKWKSRADHHKLRVCKLCYANLQAQWNEYEYLEEDRVAHNPWKRKYRVHHFTCYGCGDSVHRSNICVVPRQDCKGYLKEGAKFAVQLEEFIAMCSECKQKLHDSLSCASNEDDKTSIPSKDSRASTPYSPSKESYETSSKEDSLRNERSRSVDVCEDAGMKATATVPPLPTIMMGSQTQERGPTQNQGEDREGSFAAALRKLAQQALVPERGHMMPERPGGPKVSKASSHGRSTPSGTDSPSRRQSRQILPGIFARPGPESFCASRDDHRPPHGGESPPRDMSDRHQPTLSGSNFSMAAFSAHGAKDRSSSNVGLVHPQPVRKLPEEEHGSKLLSSVRCPSRDPPSSVFRPPSPSEAFSRFGPFSAAVHSHGAQAPCPVHGHESGHRHGSPGEHGPRPHGLPFEGLAGNGLSEIRPYHAHRFREDFYPLHRHGMEVSKAIEGPTYIRERKEPFAHHMMDEDLRRRGYDWPWPPMQPAFYDTEQYRRHLLSSFRSHDHPYKDVPHGQLYYSSLPYYGREFPLPVDPYLHPSLVGGTDPYQHRHGPPLSPRLAEYYRRTELGILDRPREPHEVHRHGDRGSDRIKEERVGERGDRPRSSEDAKPRVEVRKHDIRNVLNHDKEKPKDTTLPSADKREEAKSAGLSRGQGPEVQDFRKLKPQTSPKKPMLFPEFSLMPQRSSESPRSTLVDQPGTSRTETKPFTSRIDFSIAGPKFLSRRPSVFEEDASKADLDAEMREFNDESAGSDDVDSNGDSFVADESEDKDKKMNYMNCLGLVPHGKRRAIEEDYERRRWERKFRKIRGRPRKRMRRETNDESDSRDRPGSELDFYTGPMTRHKQQLLQEQENLLEQIQRSKEDMDDEQDNRTDELLDFDSSKGLSPSLDQNSPRRSFLMATSCHATNKVPQPLSIDTASIEAAMKNSSQKGPSESSGLLTLYRRSELEKCKAVEQRSNFPLGERPPSIKSEESQSFSSYLRERTNSLTPRGISQGSRWLGVEEVARSYNAYRQDQEVEESLLRRAFERLKGDEEMLNHQSQQLKKDMMVLHEVKVKVGDERQKLKWTMENLHQVMRTIAAS